jgi:hypothetical protein
VGTALFLAYILVLPCCSLWLSSQLLKTTVGHKKLKQRSYSTTCMLVMDSNEFAIVADINKVHAIIMRKVG